MSKRDHASSEAPKEGGMQYKRLTAVMEGLLATLLLSGCTEVKHPAEPTPKPITAASMLPGCSNVKVNWQWTAEPATVEICVSRDGIYWARLGEQQATVGHNETYLLIPSGYLNDPTSTPRMRIGTADRRFGFETSIDMFPERNRDQ